MKNNNNVTSHSAQDYDHEVRKTIPFYDLFPDMSFRLIKALNPDPKLWLDTGCGTGTLVLKASGLFPSVKFFCTDPSDAMLSETRDKLNKLDEQRIEILTPSNTQEINRNSDSFDVITALLCHHYLSYEERIRATQRCYDLLKPGGIYITFETISPETEIGINSGLSMWKNYQLSMGKEEDEVKKHISRYGKELKPINIKQHMDVMKQSGFRTVELFWYSFMQAGFYAIK